MSTITVSDPYQPCIDRATDLLDNYRGKLVAVRKASVAGTTFSLIKVACEKGQRTIVVMPSPNSFETVEKATKAAEKSTGTTYKVVRLKSSREMCIKTKKLLENYPKKEKNPFLTKGNCGTCVPNLKAECPLQEILKNEWTVLCLTYAKLSTLGFPSKTNAALFDLIKSCDNLIMDKFTYGLLKPIPKATLKNKLNVHDYLVQDFDIDQKIADASSQYQKLFWETMKSFGQTIDEKTQSLILKEFIVFENPVSKDNRETIKSHFNEKRKIIDEVLGKNIDLLCDLLKIVSSSLLFAEHSITLNRNGEDEEQVTVIPLMFRESLSFSPSDYIRDTILAYSDRDIQSESTIVISDRLTSGKLVLLELEDTELYKNPIKIAQMCGIFFPHRIIPAIYPWGDPLETNKSQLVICGTANVGKMDFFKGWHVRQNFVKIINSLSEVHGACRIVVCCMSKDIYDYFDKWQKNPKIPLEMQIPKEIAFTTYSKARAQVIPDQNRDILILVGGANLPPTAYDEENKFVLTFAFDEATKKVYYPGKDVSDTPFSVSIQAQSLIVENRLNNAFGCVKDPLGKRLSIIYAIGLKQDKLTNLKSLQHQKIISFLSNGASPIAVKKFLPTFRLMAEVLQNFPDKIADFEELPLVVIALRVVLEKNKTVAGSDIFREDSVKMLKAIEKYSVYEVLKKHSDIFLKFNVSVEYHGRGFSLQPIKKS